MHNLLAFLETMLTGVLLLSPVFLTLMGLIIINGLVIGRLEGWRMGDALYHAFINATTVGYGDFRPSRGATKVLAIVNAFFGLLLTGVFVGLGVYAVEAAFRVPAL